MVSRPPHRWDDIMDCIHADTCLCRQHDPRLDSALLRPGVVCADDRWDCFCGDVLRLCRIMDGIASVSVNFNKLGFVQNKRIPRPTRTPATSHRSAERDPMASNLESAQPDGIQLGRPVRRHPAARLAAVQLPFETPLADPAAEPWVLLVHPVRPVRC
jgi:hypothetical protein